MTGGLGAGRATAILKSVGDRKPNAPECICAAKLPLFSYGRDGHQPYSSV